MTMIGRFPYTMQTSRHRKQHRNQYNLKCPPILKKIARVSKGSQKNLVGNDVKAKDWNRLENIGSSSSHESGSEHTDDDNHHTKDGENFSADENNDYCFVYHSCSVSSCIYYIITFMSLLWIGRKDKHM